MTRFDVALKMVMAHEGRGEAPNDPGGRTDYGISERAHPDAWADGKISSDEIWHIYHQHYWLPIKGEQFRDGRLALEVFDFAVNAGPKPASLVLQQAYNAVFSDIGRIAEDGVIGPETLGAANGVAGNSAIALYQYYVASRVNWYASRAYIKQHGWKHRRGWLARCGCGERWSKTP